MVFLTEKTVDVPWRIRSIRSKQRVYLSRSTLTSLYSTLASLLASCSSLLACSTVLRAISTERMRLWSATIASTVLTSKDHCAHATSGMSNSRKAIRYFFFILSILAISMNCHHHRPPERLHHRSTHGDRCCASDGGKKVTRLDTNAVTEEVQGYLDPMAVRSSYPMAKRASENLCCLYASEYGVPVMIARLTQTTGAGIAKDDNRIIAQFAKLASQGKDIVLNTTGESARPYCYTTDTISALLFILFSR